MQAKRVLLTDANERATLAAGRSLVSAGYEVHVVAPSRLSLAGASRSVRSHVVTQNSLLDPAGFAAAVGQVADRIGAAVLLPTTDQSVEAVLHHRASLPGHLRIPLPDLGIYQGSSDKVALLEVAQAAGFAVPPSHVLRSAADLLPAGSDSWFPAVLKPHRSVVSDGGRCRKVGVAFVDRADALPEQLRAFPQGAFPLLFQQRVAGTGEGFFALRWGGRHVAAFAHRRLREMPPAGGVSVYRESISLAPELAQAGWRLLDGLQWSGVAMIECKRDLRTGRHVVMEVNGRFWGSLQLAVDAGVDFPALLVRCALGEHVSEQNAYQTGIRSRWFWGDVDHLYLRLRRSAAELHLDSQAPSRLEALGRFFSFRPGQDRWEVWRWRDPGPPLVEALRRFGMLR